MDIKLGPAYTPTKIRIKTKLKTLKYYTLKTTITQQMIDSADLLSVHTCIGALALQSVFPGAKYIGWGICSGNRETQENTQYFKFIDEAGLPVNMMRIAAPVELTCVEITREEWLNL